MGGFEWIIRRSSYKYLLISSFLVSAVVAFLLLINGWKDYVDMDKLEKDKSLEIWKELSKKCPSNRSDIIDEEQMRCLRRNSLRYGEVVFSINHKLSVEDYVRKVINNNKVYMLYLFLLPCVTIVSYKKFLESSNLGWKIVSVLFGGVVALVIMVVGYLIFNMDFLDAVIGSMLVYAVVVLLVLCLRDLYYWVREGFDMTK